MFLPLLVLALMGGIYIRREIANVTLHLEAILVSELGRQGRFRLSLQQADASRPGLLTLRNLRVTLPETPSTEPPLLQAALIHIRYDWRSLLRDRQNLQAHVSSIDIISPVLTLTRDRKGQWVLPPAAPRRLPPRKVRAAPFAGTLTITGGKLVVRDAYVDPGRWRTHELCDIQAHLDARDSPVLFLSAMAQGGADFNTLQLKGRLDSEKNTQALDLSARAIALPSLTPYLPLPRPIHLREGRLDISLTALKSSDRLDLLGSAQWLNGSVDWKTITARQLRGEVRFTGQTARIDLKGRAANSPLQVSGLLYNWKSPKLFLSLKGQVADLVPLEKLAPPLARVKKYASLSLPVRMEARIEGSATDPLISGKLEAPALQIRKGRYSERLEAITLQAHYHSKFLQIQNLTARASRGTLRLNGYVDLSKDSPCAYLAAEAHSLQLKEKHFPIIHPQGITDLGLTLTWRQNRPDVIMDVKISEGKFLRTAFRDLRASLRWGGDEIVLRGARGRIAGGWVDARGTIELSGTVDLALNALDIDLEELTQPYGRLALKGAGYLNGRLISTGKEPTLIGDIQVFNGRFETLAWDLAAGKLEASPEAVRFIECEVSRYPGRVRLNGSLELQKGKVHQVHFAGHAMQMPVTELAKAFSMEMASPLEGILEGDFTMEGPPNDLIIKGPVTLKEGHVAQIPLPPLKGQFRWQQKALHLDDVEGSFDGEKLKLQGRYDGEIGFDFTFRARRIPLLRLQAYLAPYLVPEGEAEVEGRISGPPDQPRVEITKAVSERPRLNGHTFDKMEASLRWEGGHLKIDDLQLHENGALYQAGDTSHPVDIDLTSHETEARIKISKGRASTLVALMKSSPYMATPAGQKVLKVLGGLPRNTEGEIDADLEMEGDLTDPRITLNLKAVEVQVGQIAHIDEGSARAILENGAFKIQKLRLTEQETVVQASGIIDPLGSLALDIDASNLNAALLRPLIPKRFPVEGTADIFMLISGLTKKPTLDASVTITNASLKGVPFDAVQSQKIRLVGSRFDLGEVIFVQNGREARVWGAAPVPWASKAEKATIPYDLHAEIKRQDLSYLAGLLPKMFDKTGGTLDARLDITGIGEGRQITGGLQVTDGMMQFQFQRQDKEAALKNIGADLSFAGATVTIKHLTGNSRSGSFQASGTMDVSDLPDARLKVDLVLDQLYMAGQDLTPLYREHFAGSLTTREPLSISGVWRRPRILGTVLIHDARALLPSQARPSSGTSNGEAAVKPVFDPGFDLKVVVGDNAWLESQGQRLRALTRGEVSIGGQFTDLRVQGHIALERGVVYFPTARFRLKTGDIDFAYVPNQGTQAYLNVQAQTNLRARIPGAPSGSRQTQEYRIDLTLSGSLDRPLKVQATSSPPFLSQREIFALLLHEEQVAGIFQGQDTERRLGEEVGQLLFTSAAAPLIFEPVESFLTGAFKLEEFSLEYNWRQPLQVRIGKRLTKHLLATYIRSLDPQYERYIFRLGYQLTDRLHLNWGIDERSVQTLTLEGILRF